MVVPWVQSVHDLRNSLVVEVGCQSGCCSSAFAQQAKKVIGFDIDPHAVSAFDGRMEILELTNAQVVGRGFAEASYQALGIEPPDVILLFATLEHMTFAERISILRSAWQLLMPGGVLVIGDTPNWLSPFDLHSAHLPLFHWLSHDVQEHYGCELPRQEFVRGLSRSAAQSPMRRDEFLERFGLGVTYHDFEIALGKSVHQYVIADGSARILQKHLGWTFEDSLIELIFDHYKIPAHRCFARRALYLILRKP